MTYNEKAEYLEKTSLGETAEKVLKDLGKPSIIRQRGDIKEYVYINPKTEDMGKLERISLCVVYGKVIRTAVSKGNRDKVKETSPEDMEAIMH